MSKWRPEGWEQPVTNDTAILTFEKGADAMLEALRSKADIYVTPSGYTVDHNEMKRLNNGYHIVSIPDDLPAVKPKPQLMICPAGDKCHIVCELKYKPHDKNPTCEVSCGKAGGAGAGPCIPYVPEKKTLAEELKVNPYGFEFNPYRKSDWMLFWSKHKASQVVASGRFCNRCGKQIPNNSPAGTTHCGQSSEHGRENWGIGK
jgi:hypothetical protein